MSTTGRPCAVKVDSCTEALLSSFTSEKSGAGSPTCKPPARACVHNVSNGRTRNATGPGNFAMNRANVSGGFRMTSYSAPQASTHTRAITANALTNALFTNVRFVNKVLLHRPLPHACTNRLRKKSTVDAQPLKGLLISHSTASLKRCPNTKPEFFRSLLKQKLQRHLDHPVGLDPTG